MDLILEKNEEQHSKSINIVSYNFEICDMLLNIAPCGHSIIGESVGDYSEFETDTIQYHIDLVICNLCIYSKISTKEKLNK